MQLGPETCEEGGLLVQLCCCVISTTARLQLTAYRGGGEDTKDVLPRLQVVGKFTGWKQVQRYLQEGD